MDFKGTGCEGVGRIQMAQNWIEWQDLVNTAMNVISSSLE